MLDLQRLQYFIAVARHEHVGRAARELHISQSPLSRQIQQLEGELGLALFTREKKRLKLTRSGRTLLADAERLIEQEGVLRRRASALAEGREGTLTIGYVEGAVYAGVLARDLAGLRKSAPALRVELKGLTTAAQVAALKAGALDYGYTYSGALPDSGLRSRLVHEEGFCLAVPSSVQAPRGKLPIVALNAIPLIIISESVAPRARAAFVAALAGLGVTPEVQVEASDPAILLALVSAHAGFAVLQSSLRAFSPRGVRWLPLPRRFGLKMQVHRMHGALPPAAASRALLD